MEIFGRSRRQLAFAYALIMGVFLALIIFVMHVAMNWSMFSEQAQELSDAAAGVAETQVFYLQNTSKARTTDCFFTFSARTSNLFALSAQVSALNRSF